MVISGLRGSLDLEAAGQEMYALCEELFPICRSITGDGVRRTLGILGRSLPITVHEVPTGTKVLDWTVPREWNVTDAHVSDAAGRRVIDFGRSNLHLVGYSIPVRARMGLEELRPHLFTMPDRPAWVPYRTSYYKESWGFCLSHDDLTALTDQEYEVVVDSTLEEGSLTYGECVIEGDADDEVLVSCHVCHPSLANDNLSGMALVTALGSCLARLDLRYSYRLLFVPGTIGSITWLAANEAGLGRVRHGLVVTGAGDAGPITYKRSRRGDADIDRVMALVLREAGEDHRVIDFHPYGYDERQFCSPGFDLPVGRFGRSTHGEYPEYHTSADDLTFVQPRYLAASLSTLLATVEVLEGDGRYRNLSPKGEPQLGARGLYGSVGGNFDPKSFELALLWVLNQSDGQHSLLDIAERSGMAFADLRRAAVALVDHDLLERC